MSPDATMFVMVVGWFPFVLLACRFTDILRQLSPSVHYSDTYAGGVDGYTRVFNSSTSWQPPTVLDNMTGVMWVC